MENILAARQHELVGMLYDAVLHPEGWQQWLDALVVATGSRSGLLVLQNAGNLDIGYTIQTGFDQSLRELYNRDYREHDLWTSRLSHLDRDTVYPTRSMVPQKEFHRSVIYNEFCRPLDVEHGAGAFLTTGGSWSIRFALQRTGSQGEYTDREIALLQQFVPHLQRSLHISQELGHARGSLEAMIEQLKVPCVLLETTRKIVAMNRRARVLAEVRNEIRIRENHLEITHPETARRVNALIDGCKPGNCAAGQPAGGYAKLPRKNRMPLVISVTPFPVRHGCRLCNTRVIVALLFHDPELRLFPTEQILLEIYGLTRTEARVATLLASGCSIEEITGKLQVSVNTVKSHLKAIFAKTGTSRQGEVVSLIMSRGMYLAEDREHDSGCWP